MPEATSPPWFLDAILFAGAFAAMTWGFMALFKPRMVQSDDAPADSIEE